MHRLLSLIAGLSFLAAPLATAQPLQPQRVTLDAPSLPGLQSLAADQKGRLYLLRGDPPAFFGVDPSGEVDAWSTSTESSLLEPPVLDATISRDGSAWFLLSPEGVFRADRRGVEEVPDPHWKPLSLAHDGSLVAGVVPVLRGRTRPPGLDLSEPPLLWEFDGSRWSTRVPGPFSEAEIAADASGKDMSATYDTYRHLLLTPASPTGLWAAHHYLYRVRRYSPTGREKLDLQLADAAAPSHIEDEQVIDKLRSSVAEAAREAGMAGAEITVITAKAVIGDIAEGRDGTLYILAAPGLAGPNPVLDRYDPVRQRLERLELAFDWPGRVELAAGRHALWIAARAADQEVWRLPWADLADAAWEPVVGLLLDGQPVPVVGGEDASPGSPPP